MNISEPQTDPTSCAYPHVGPSQGTKLGLLVAGVALIVIIAVSLFDAGSQAADPARPQHPQRALEKNAVLRSSAGASSAHDQASR